MWRECWLLMHERTWHVAYGVKGACDICRVACRVPLKPTAVHSLFITVVSFVVLGICFFFSPRTYLRRKFTVNLKEWWLLNQIGANGCRRDGNELADSLITKTTFFWCRFFLCNVSLRSQGLVILLISVCAVSLKIRISLSRIVSKICFF